MSESESDLIVLDSGPIIGLSSVGRLDLLSELYSGALIPDAVYQEVVIEGAGLPGSRELLEASWIDRVALDIAPDPLLVKELGAGESEAITLAYRRGVPQILADDRRARRIAAQAYGLHVRGTAGVLVAAKRAQLITSVRELIEGIRPEGYYISDRLMEYACRQVGE